MIKTGLGFAFIETVVRSKGLFHLMRESKASKTLEGNYPDYPTQGVEGRQSRSTNERKV